MLNPLVHSIQYKGRLTKILILVLKKISYKSVDEKILS